MLWKYAVFFCTLLAWPAQVISKGGAVPPESVRSTVFRLVAGGPSSKAKFLTVVVSAPQVAGLAGPYVRLRVLVGRYSGPYLPAKAASQTVLDVLVRPVGRQVRYWPQLLSISADGAVPCRAEETSLLDLGDTLRTVRRARHQTCYTFLQTQLLARTPLPGTPDTLSRYQVGTVAASTHLAHVSGLEVDQQLRVRGIVYRTTHGSIGRGFQDEQLIYRGDARLEPVHP
jgi:hypothetical protein